MRVPAMIVVAAALSGCVPAPYGPYYRPSYPDPSSTLQKAYCGGQAGPPARLAFQGPGDVGVSVRAETPLQPGEPRLLHVAIDLPAGTRFQFLAETVALAASRDDEAASRVPAVSVTASLKLQGDDWIDFAQAGPTSLDVARRYLAANPEGRFADVRFDIGRLGQFAPARMQVEFPALQLDTASVAIPGMELQQQAGSSFPIYRTAEYAQTLQQRYAACLRQTPASNCHYIPTHDPYGFRHEAERFALAGRFWVTGEAAQATLNAEFEAGVRVSGRWRFADNEVRLRDAASGEVRVMPLRNPRVVWSYAVPLAAEVRSVAAGSTRIDVRTSVGGDHEASRYVLTLPPFLLNGTRHEFGPIEFERRLFDGGFEPFNC